MPERRASTRKQIPRRLTRRAVRLPLQLPGRHLRIVVEVHDGQLAVLRTRLINSSLVRSPVCTGGMVTQITQRNRLLWVDTLPFDRIEYGISRPDQPGHSEGPATQGVLVSVRVPVATDRLAKDLAIRLFAVKDALPRDIHELDSLLWSPRARPRALQSIGRISLRTLLGHPQFLRTLERGGIRVPGIKLPMPKRKPSPDSLSQLVKLTHRGDA